MHRSIENKRKEIEALCRRFGVTRLEIFGSAARGDDFDPEKSDADFLVEFKEISLTDPLGEFFQFERALASVIGREVDLIEVGANINPVLRRNINMDRQVVYAAQH